MADGGLGRLNGIVRNPLARQNAIYFSGSILAVLLSYAYHFISGRLLGPRAYGPVAAIVSLYFLLLVPGQLILTVAMRYAATFIVSGPAGRIWGAFRYLSRLTWVGSLSSTG